MSRSSQKHTRTVSMASWYTPMNAAAMVYDTTKTSARGTSIE